MTKTKKAPAYSPLWKKLYSLIKEFNREKPWELFENEDFFIVESPRNHQMYLCCVMGNGGEEFGLNAFRGAQGMRNFGKILSLYDNGQSDKDLIYELDMLSFSLCPRDFMERSDLAVTKKLMLSFTGETWPLLRSYRPHFLPWFLTELELEDLCDCLEQTLALYGEGNDTLEAIRNAAEGEALVRRKEDDLWVTETLPIVYPNEKTPDIGIDEITIHRLSNLPATGSSEEIDLFHLSEAITDHEPPYFGQILAGVNEELFAHQYGAFTPFCNFLQEACNALVQAFLSRGSKPCRIRLREDSPFAGVFERIASQAGIMCEVSESLPLISDLQDSLEEAFSNGSFQDIVGEGRS